jgi:ParB family transcriptional regulator, chromosome partitioning protein
VTKDRRLGRGLEALLGHLPGRAAQPAPAQQPANPYEDAYDRMISGKYGQPEPAAQQPPTAQSPLLPHAAAPNIMDESLAHFTPRVESDPSQTISKEPQFTESDAAKIVESETLEKTIAEPTDFPRIDIKLINSSPHQPRREFEPAAMKSLAESIGEHGLLQPVVLRRAGERYELIAGERRLRAAIQAGWNDVPAHVIEADDQQVAEMSIIENLHRKDLNPLEKAVSFQRYIEQYGCTQEELASRLKLDRSTIANLIRLLELPELVQQTIRQGKITQGHARALLPLGDEREQIEFCQRIQRESLNVRQTESLVQQTIKAADAEPLSVIGTDGSKTRPKLVKNDHIASLEQQIRAALGLKISLTHNAKGRGKLVIHFSNHEEFERLRGQLCDTPRPAAQNRAS